MIRTVIEVSGETQWEFEGKLKTTLSALGYAKRDEGEISFYHHLAEALREINIDPHKLVEERKERIWRETIMVKDAK